VGDALPDLPGPSALGLADPHAQRPHRYLSARLPAQGDPSGPGCGSVTDWAFVDDDAANGSQAGPAPADGAGRPLVSSVLLRLIAAAGARSARDQDGAPHVIIDGAALSPAEAGGWATDRYYREHGRAPSRDAVRDAVAVLAARAQHGAEVEPIYLRVAPTRDGIALDLGRPDHAAVIVGPHGWTVGAPPVLFRRPPHLGELPVPSVSGSLDGLGPLVNVPADALPLLVGWLLGALRPRGPYAVLGLTGEPGSGKSMTARLVRALVDPVTVGPGLASLGRDPADVFASAAAGWVASFDNLSGIAPDTSDVLCRIASGGSYSARAKYSDLAEFRLTVQRPLILNGIELSARGDLLDRSIVVPIPRLSEYTTEEALVAALESRRPAILGALMDATVGALATIASRPQRGWGSRMADHVRWVSAAEAALGWAPGTYAAAFARQNELALVASADAIPWLPALQRLLDDNGGSWDGSAGHLLASLQDRSGDGPRRHWPEHARGLSGALRRNAHALAAVGIQWDERANPHTKTAQHFITRGEVSA
jgi:hypothetical protein